MVSCFGHPTLEVGGFSLGWVEGVYLRQGLGFIGLSVGSSLFLERTTHITLSISVYA